MPVTSLQGSLLERVVFGPLFGLPRLQNDTPDQKPGNVSLGELETLGEELT